MSVLLKYQLKALFESGDLMTQDSLVDLIDSTYNPVLVAGTGVTLNTVTTPSGTTVTINAQGGIPFGGLTTIGSSGPATLSGAGILNIPLKDMAANEISGRSRGTPRISNSLLRRVRDFAQIKGNGTIDIEITRYALKSLNVDKNGLDEMDNKILSTLIEKFKGGPVGINTLSTAVSESAETIEEVYEPFLIQQGFIVRTPRGREVTKLAYDHLGLKKSQSLLLEINY
mgnify:CR=1 FL=1